MSEIIRVEIKRNCTCPSCGGHVHYIQDSDGCCWYKVPPYYLDIVRRDEDGMMRGRSMFHDFRGAKALRKKYFSAFERVVENLWQTLPKGEFVDITSQVGGLLEEYLEDLQKISRLPRKAKIEL